MLISVDCIATEVLLRWGKFEDINNTNGVSDTSLLREFEHSLFNERFPDRRSTAIEVPHDTSLIVELGGFSLVFGSDQPGTIYRVVILWLFDFLVFMFHLLLVLTRSRGYNVFTVISMSTNHTRWWQEERSVLNTCNLLY